jgi:predicted nucleic acid-binding protein
MKYLLDANSLMLLIKRADAKLTVECLLDSLILDLTFYEIGNAFWKESALLKFLTLEEVKMLGNRSQIILSKINQVKNDSEDFQKILEIAQNENLSFYDSSYVFYAKQRGLQLITEDKKLALKAKKHVIVITFAEPFSQQK